MFYDSHRPMGLSSYQCCPTGEYIPLSPLLTSSGFSLVIRAAMTWPLGTGGLAGLLKQMGLSPHGLSPYSTRMSFILCKGMPIAICTRNRI